MKLLTKELKLQLIRAYQNDPYGETPFEEQMVYAKFFYPAGYATWFLTAFSPEDQMLFGFAALFPYTGEWGWISFEELESFVDKHGLKIERDLYFTPAKVKDCKELQRYMKGE